MCHDFSPPKSTTFESSTDPEKISSRQPLACLSVTFCGFAEGHSWVICMSPLLANIFLLTVLLQAIDHSDSHLQMWVTMLGSADSTTQYKLTLLFIWKLVLFFYWQTRSGGRVMRRMAGEEQRVIFFSLLFLNRPWALVLWGLRFSDRAPHNKSLLCQREKWLYSNFVVEDFFVMLMCPAQWGVN